MLLQVPEDLFAIRVRDLGVHFGILDIAVTQVIGHILNAAAGFYEVHGDRVAERMDGSAGNARRFGVGLEEMLHHAFFERPFTAGEEVWACISAHPQICPQGFGGVPPEGFLAADTVLKAPDPDTVLFEADVI
jgi:hypothetical protein